MRAKVDTDFSVLVRFGSGSARVARPRGLVRSISDRIWGLPMDSEKGAIVIREGDGNGSVFVPTRGYQYYLDQLLELSMEIEHAEPGFAILKLTTDDLWSLRHCAVEALGSDELEFRARVGAAIADVEVLVRDLKNVAKLTEIHVAPPDAR